MSRRRRPIRIGPYTNISRDGCAWVVCVRRCGWDIPGYFSDDVWGGEDLALVAAQRYRDELLREVEPDLRVRQRVPKGVRSETGLVGVGVEPHVVDGRVYRRYVARWSDPEKGPQRRRFSVNLYGEERARALAIEAREQGVARSRALLMARQVTDAARRLEQAPPMPRVVKDPLSRKGIRMPPRRRSG